MKTNLKKIYIIVCCMGFLSVSQSVFSQDPIYLSNPSFEDEPSDATVPQAWFGCAEGTTPDILPGFWGVYTESSDGETYIGMITRENGTYESIGQRLSSILSPKSCYNFSLDLARSDNYTGYNKAIHIRIWISSNKCDKEQMVYDSGLIKNTEWEKHKVEFVPIKEAKYIKIEAFINDSPVEHKGNILIDHISAIVPCSRV